jgi:signal peptidase II
MSEAQIQSTSSTHLGWRAGYMVAAFGIYMVDQVSKAWASRTLRFTGDLTIIHNYLDFIYTRNNGIAFGQLQDSGSFARWLFVGLAVAAVMAVLIYFLRTPRDDDRILGACALLIGGITGNLTDRVRFGFVIDFIVVHFRSWHWPTFNVADASICCGALLLAYDLMRGRKKPVVSGQ